MDMSFAEDDCRIRAGDGAQNFAILRRLALNLIKQEKSTKTSVNIKRLQAGWSTTTSKRCSACSPIELNSCHRHARRPPLFLRLCFMQSPWG